MLAGSLTLYTEGAWYHRARMSNGITSRETSYSVRGVYRFDSILSLSFLFLSLSPILVRPTNRPKGYKRTDPCVSPLFPLIFSPSLSLFLSLAVSTIQFLPSYVSLSSFLLCTEREREGKFFFSWRKRGKNSSLFFFLLFFSFFFQRGKKGKDSTGNRAEEHLLLVARRIEGEVSWPESWVQQGAPGEIPSHGYWFTMPRIIRHYLMWYMGSRGQRFSRLERRERERDRLVKAFFPLRLRGESLICMIDGTRLHDRTHPITDRPPIVKLDV